MRKRGLLVLGLFFMIFSISGVLSECQYKDYIEGNVSVSHLYDLNGTLLTNVLEVRNTQCSWSGITGWGGCSFEVFNNINYPVSVRVEFVRASSTQVEEVVIPSNQFVSISRSFSDATYILFNTIVFKYHSNNYTEARLEKEIFEICKDCVGITCLNDGQSCSQSFQCGSGICKEGVCVNEQSSFEERVSNLEINMTLLQLWKNTITTTITSILTDITNLFTITSNLDARVTNLENQNITQPNITIESYWKYLSSGERKNIVCGYAEDNHLTSLTMLGWNCKVTYKNTSRGESSSCRCSS